MTELLNQFSEHLQVFGYETTQVEGQPLVRAEHPRHLNFNVLLTAGGVLMRSYINTSPLAKQADMLEYVNELNRDAAVIRFLLDKDGDFTLEAWWPPLYDRVQFGNFMDAWHRDTGLIAGHARSLELLS
jgi:hypothetical protein